MTCTVALGLLKEAVGSALDESLASRSEIVRILKEATAVLQSVAEGIAVRPAVGFLFQGNVSIALIRLLEILTQN